MVEDILADHDPVLLAFILEDIGHGAHHDVGLDELQRAPAAGPVKRKERVAELAGQGIPQPDLKPFLVVG